MLPLVLAALAVGNPDGVATPPSLAVAVSADPRRAGAFDPSPADLAFLRTVAGQSRTAVLRRLGHPDRVSLAPGGIEGWTYFRQGGGACWVFFRRGHATLGVPSDGVQIGGAAFRW